MFILSPADMAILGRCHATQAASQPPVPGTGFYLQLTAKLQQSQHFHVEHHQRGIKVQSLHFFSSLSHLKTLFLCMSLSCGFKCLSLPGWSRINTLRAGNGSAQSLQLLWVKIRVCRAKVAPAALGRDGGGPWSHLVGPAGWFARAQSMEDAASRCGASLAI